ncbi:putative NAD(P)H oxidase [Klebsormidium nitens]|uniref:Putative NAD(P)H oxidase n=1 Tax=Klebsormidium nitens TaxID=105231 RepID=A0A1Y1IIU0_KLENI|nr:putative NAD(P)H oxidase [Klebsormidium nitens]|eukprot:GAQ89041.1 putative NAD(P)H oxidase [Klebsormidium nitens]
MGDEGRPRLRILGVLVVLQLLVSRKRGHGSPPKDWREVPVQGSSSEASARQGRQMRESFARIIARAKILLQNLYSLRTWRRLTNFKEMVSVVVNPVVAKRLNERARLPLRKKLDLEGQRGAGAAALDPLEGYWRSDISRVYGEVKPDYWNLLGSFDFLSGLLLLLPMVVAFPLALSYFRTMSGSSKGLRRYLACVTGFNAFWYSHHTLLLMYVVVIFHGTRSGHWYVPSTTAWVYIVGPLGVYLAERLLRWYRGSGAHHQPQVLQAVSYSGKVLLLELSKPSGFRYRSGMFVYIQCPAASRFEWHPFTLTSAPGDDTLSLHIRVAGDWTSALLRKFESALDATNSCPSHADVSSPGYAAAAAALSTVPPSQQEDQEPDLELGGRNERPSWRHVAATKFPSLRMDGPYGAPAQEYRRYKTVLLVGAGIGITPYVSILRDLLHRFQTEQDQPQARDSSGAPRVRRVMTEAVYCYWVTRDHDTVAMLRDLLQSLAQREIEGRLEVHICLTGQTPAANTTPALSSVSVTESSAASELGTSPRGGMVIEHHNSRPDWDSVLSGIAGRHPKGDVGVFYCGKPGIAAALRSRRSRFSLARGTFFRLHKETF